MERISDASAEQTGRIFQPIFADHRVVRIPPDLTDESRRKFVVRIGAAVKKQAQLTGGNDTVLRVTGEIREQDDEILIPHEPAAPAVVLTPEACLAPLDLETLWWLTDAVARAVHALGSSAAHGAIQLATLYQDEAGRAKLGDFGIASAYLASCGVDAGRRLICDARAESCPDGRQRSGVWELLDEGAVREDGWVSPYFAPELLDGSTRPNPKTDFFAAGTLLFLLGSGHCSHAYGADFSDPSHMFYFHLEPLPLAEEREDWEATFKRRAAKTANAADQRIIAWCDIVQKLLAYDWSDRWVSTDELLQSIGDHAAPVWAQTSTVITHAVERLDTGQVDDFLAQATEFQHLDQLPVVWREQLERWLAQVEAKREAIIRRKKLERRFAEGRAALGALDFALARERANEVLQSDDATNLLRASAEELLQHCDEQEAFVASGADDIARSYLESAGGFVEQDKYAEAQNLLNGVLNDPATPPNRATQARELLTDVELKIQRDEQHTQELATAREEFDHRQFEAAEKRLASLLAEDDLAAARTVEAEQLLENVQAARQRELERIEAVRAALDQADVHYQTGDVETARKILQERVLNEAHLPKDLTERIETLRRACERVALARRAFQVVDQYINAARFTEATTLLDRIQTEGFPQAVIAEIAALRERVGVARAEYTVRARKKLAAQVEALDASIDAGDLDAADLTLQQLEASSYLTDALRERADTARRAVDLLRPLLDAIRSVVDALAQQRIKQAKPLAAPEKLLSDLLAWSRERVETVSGRRADAAQQVHEAGLREVLVAVETARASLGREETTDAGYELKRAKSMLEELLSGDEHADTESTAGDS